ncbi:hypothetical protein LINPERHAP1_LOCUS7256, partial [Linum perenne]
KGRLIYARLRASVEVDLESAFGRIPCSNGSRRGWIKEAAEVGLGVDGFKSDRIECFHNRIRSVSFLSI